LCPQLFIPGDHLARGVQVGNQVVNLRRKRESPVDIVLVTIVAALVTGLMQLLGQLPLIVGHEQ